MMIGLKRLFIEAMAKHLPPSAAELRLLDVGGLAGERLAALRGDLHITPVSAAALHHLTESADAVVAYDAPLDARFLRGALGALRPGGRLIALLPDGDLDESYVGLLEAAGYTRILVEIALGCPVETGLLVRGERPHRTANTLERIEQVAARDTDALSLADFKGRYIYLLVRQTPNKPAWKLEPGEAVTWEASALDMPEGVRLLAFSSLPKAVGFMQTGVLAGTVRDVNKVPRFRREVAQGWPWSVLLNPTPDALTAHTLTLVAVDPASAEAPDE